MHKLTELSLGLESSLETAETPGKHTPIAAKSPMTGKVKAMTAYLTPYAGNLEQPTAHMEDAFMAVKGRVVDKNDAHDLMLCQAALAPFNMEDV